MKGDEILRQHRIDCKQMAVDVMPDYWSGHGALLIYESEDIPKQLEETAIEKMNALVESSDASPEAAAQLLIKKFTEK